MVNRLPLEPSWIWDKTSNFQLLYIIWSRPLGVMYILYTVLWKYRLNCKSHYSSIVNLQPAFLLRKMPLSGTFWGMEIGFGKFSYMKVSRVIPHRRGLYDLNIFITSMSKLYYQYFPGIPNLNEFGTQQLYFIVLIQLCTVHLIN